MSPALTEDMTEPARLIARAAHLGEQASEYLAASERQRRMPDEAIELLVQSKLLLALRPRRVGGLEVDLPTYVEIVREIAKRAPSLGWLYGVMSIHQWYMAYLNPKFQDEVWGGEEESIVVDSFALKGQAERVEDGFLLSGQWKFTSGVEWCSWAGFGALPTLPDGSGPEPCLLFLPRSEFEVIDDWHTIGMRGTASRSVRVVKAFVPDHRVFHTMRVAISGNPQGVRLDDGPLYRGPWTPTFTTALLPVALGIAERAIEEFTKWTNERVRALAPGEAQREDPNAQLALAEASVRWDAAYALTKRYATDVDRLGRERRSEDDPVTRAKFFAWRAYISRTSCEIVERLFLESGGNAIFESHPMQQLWRDCHAAAQQVSLGYSDGMTSYGRNLMGFPGHSFL
jgi:3-hydroxy-9,10-secoandrosta-1,3,5(10)-triene-9,17-dione monooxygenase